MSYAQEDSSWFLVRAGTVYIRFWSRWRKQRKPGRKLKSLEHIRIFLVISYFTALLPDSQAHKSSSPMSRDDFESAIQSTVFLIFTSSSNATTDSKMKRMDDTRPANVDMLNVRICVVHYLLRDVVLGIGENRPGCPNKGLEVAT